MDGSSLADLVTGAVLLASGAIAATRRRGRAAGVLLIATGAAWLAGSAFGALVFLYRGPLVHLLLTYPRMRISGRGRRALAAAAYISGAVEPVGASELLTAVLCAAVVAAVSTRWARAGGVERRAAASALDASPPLLVPHCNSAVAQLRRARRAAPNRPEAVVSGRAKRCARTAPLPRSGSLLPRACSSSKASAATPLNARSLLHECRRRLAGARPRPR